MTWQINIHYQFEEELRGFTEAAQSELAASVLLLERNGPNLSRPHADTLNDSKYANMKELRFKADGGMWRVAFAFDPI